MYYVGVDYHKCYSVATVLDADGTKTQRGSGWKCPVYAWCFWCLDGSMSDSGQRAAVDRPGSG